MISFDTPFGIWLIAMTTPATRKLKHYLKYLVKDLRAMTICYFGIQFIGSQIILLCYTHSIWIMSSSKRKLLLVFIVIMIIITNIPRCNDRSLSSRSICDGSSNGVCLFIVSFLSFSSSLSLNSCYTHCSKKGFVKGINNLPSLLSPNVVTISPNVV